MTAGQLPDWLGRRAVTHACQPALLTGSFRWTFAELDSRVSEAVQRLAAQGVVAGDRVALLARNGPAFVVVTHALGRLGAVLVPLNVRLTPSELAWQLSDVKASVLLHDDVHADLASAVFAQVPDLRTVTIGPEGPIDPTANTVPLRDRITLDAIQGIVYTSGTTGRPKGALLTYGNHWWSATGSALHLGHYLDDRWLAVLPLFHVGGLAILFRSVIAGVPIVLHETFDPVRANRAIDEDGITLLSVVANVLQRMLETRGDDSYPATLRCVLLGGGPAPRSLLDACLRRGLPVAPSYGMTEASSQIATLLPEEVPRHFGAAGRPLPSTEVRIERDGKPVPAGEIGEIVVRGPTITPGYVGREAKGNEVGPDGWLRTGDLGRLDDEGYLFVLDRRDDLIISGGENVFPAEIEWVLLTHPGVAEAAVIGVPDARWGAVPVAFVRRKVGWATTEDELLALCATRLADFKRPQRITWIDALPRNASGKLLRRELRTNA
ncbi:MAG: o-succinylbenzoate---CoA ligase [Thermomicrobiales bacterium]|jgi:O-succinylbenzoic acid--CoA ligase|nr:o-succinylbenzoate---CoA ligase [Thermomicrobiales bacterium]